MHAKAKNNKLNAIFAMLLCQSTKGPFKRSQHLLQHAFNTVVEPNVGGVLAGRSTLLKA